MQRFIISLMFVLILALAAPSAYAALTNDQINAILNLLRSFNAEESIIANVEASLRGTTVTSCPDLTYNLSQGATDATTGGEVTFVQTLLGVEPVSGYYGPLTEKAVQDFQTAHGIVAYGTPETTGFGAVGPLTRAALRDACFATLPETGSSGTTQSTGTQTTQTSSTSSSSSVSYTGSTVSDSQVKDLIYEQAVESGLPGDSLAQVRSLLDSIGTTTVEAARTSTDTGSQSSIDLSSIITPFIQKLIDSVFTTAQSGGGQNNFGTPEVLFTLECDCSHTVLIYMQPVGPKYVKALTYVRGTQKYESFNIPVVGQALLGLYSPVGICYKYAGNSCYSIPSDGMITAIVGSSQQ